MPRGVTPAAYPRVVSATACAIAEGARPLARTLSASRAGSPLLFGLAPRGVFHAPDIATGTVGSYPTFSPLPNDSALPGRLSPAFSKTSRRFSCAMPPCCAAGGIFSVALSVTEPHRVELNSTPPVQVFNWGGKLRFAAEPAWPSPGVTRRVALTSSPALASLRRRCPDFPPVPIARDQRSPGPSADVIIEQESICHGDTERTESAKRNLVNNNPPLPQFLHKCSF